MGDDFDIVRGGAVYWRCGGRRPVGRSLSRRHRGARGGGLAHGQGLFYAKHLRAGDLAVMPFLGRDLYRGARGVAARAVRRRPGWPDPRTGLLSGLLVGLAKGWRTFGPSSRR